MPVQRLRKLCLSTVNISTPHQVTTLQPVSLRRRILIGHKQAKSQSHITTTRSKAPEFWAFYTQTHVTEYCAFQQFLNKLAKGLMNPSHRAPLTLSHDNSPSHSQEQHVDQEDHSTASPLLDFTNHTGGANAIVKTSISFLNFSRTENHEGTINRISLAHYWLSAHTNPSKSNRCCDVHS